MAIIRPKITNEANGSHNVEFIALSGMFPRFGQVVREITRPGVAGSAFRLEGRRSEPSEFIAIRDTANGAAGITARTLMQNVADFAGNLCTVKDEFGFDWTNVMVCHVQLADEKPLGAAVGGLDTPSQRLLHWRILLQFTTVPT